jgi:uncharacterized membrane protein YdbT with pleckstrin-like domain
MKKRKASREVFFDAVFLAAVVFAVVAAAFLAATFFAPTLDFVVLAATLGFARRVFTVLGVFLAAMDVSVEVLSSIRESRPGVNGCRHVFWEKITPTRYSSRNASAGDVRAIL